MFNNEQIINHDDILAMSSDRFEKHSRLSQVACSDSEKFSLQQIFNIPEEVPEISSKLAGVGLDPSYWSDKLCKKLGVTSLPALELVGGESYTELEPFARHVWEKKGLRKLLNMDEDDNVLSNQRTKQKDKLLERQKELKSLLQELKTLNSQGKDRNDKNVQSIENRAREMWQIPPSSWISSDKKLNELIHQLNQSHENISGVLASRVDLSDKALLKNASGGRALQGILHTKDLTEQLKPRACLIQAPDSVQMLGTSHPQDDKIKHFTIKEEEDMFKQAVNILGYSASVSAKIPGFWSIEAGMAFNRKCEQEQTSERHKQTTYFSTVKYSSMPLASYSFSDNDLQLSEDAIKQLRVIEQGILTYKAESDQVLRACKDFFCKFGSHANRGPLHFGGIYWWTCSSDAIASTERSTIKDLQSKAVNTDGGICTFNFGSSVALDLSSVAAKYDGKCSQSTLSRTKLEVTKTGGPQEISSLPEWKSGLVVCNSTWSLIDRGTTLVSVWDIIMMDHNRNNFEHPKSVSTQLRITWTKMTDSESSRMDIEETSCSIAEEMDRIKKWNETEGTSHIKEKLQHLLKVKKDLIKISSNPQAWSTSYLSKPSVQHFLQMVVHEEEKHPDPLGLVKLLLKQVVEKGELGLIKSTDFRGKDYIYNQLYSSQSTSQVECDNFAVLCTSIKLSVETMRTTIALVEHDTLMNVATVVSECSSRVTTSIAKAISSLRTSLIQSGHKYDDIFITTIIYPFKHGTSYQPVILKRLTEDNLKYLHKELERKSKEFLDLKVKDKDLIRMQAFLFRTAFDVSFSEHEIDVAENQIRKHVMYMEREIGEELHAQVRELLALYFSDSKNWEKLQEELTQMVMTNSSLLQQTEKCHSLDSILDDNEVRIIWNTERSKPSCIPQKNGRMMDLMKSLHLEQFYPQKMVLNDALCIRKELLEMSQCTEKRQLPLFMLHNILAYKNHWRKLQLIDNEEESSASESDSSLFSDGEESDHSSYHDARDSIDKYNPMDILLLLLHCADDFLRQDLLSRLATIQHAIPIILPDSISQQLTFLTWAMRSIVKGWKCTRDGKEMEYERPLVSCRAPIVSFVRFCKHKTSKSKVINSVIGDTHYDHFFHRDCEQGTCKWWLGDGLVELCWYLPAGKSDDFFPDVIFFLNLHGDALNHPKQINFLKQISLLSFVLLKAEDLNDGYVSVLKQLSKSTASVVILNESDKGLSHHFNLDRRKVHGCKILNMNETELKEEIRKRIRKTLKQKVVEAVSFEECHSIAHDCGISTDEKSEDFMMGKKLSDEMKALLCSHKDQHVSAKELMLPLQTKELWQRWASIDKELHRQVDRGPGERIEHYAERMLIQRNRVRRLQLLQLQNLTPLMQVFIKSLVLENVNVKKYFLHCLKLHLSDLTRNRITLLQQDYYDKRKTFLCLQEKTEQNKDIIKACEEEIEAIYEQLTDASFGLEHFLRELGQMYEALQESPHKDNDRYSCLPRVAANLLIEGYALELMDGDAAHVPLKWVTAVLQEAITILKDPRVFVMSILGIQSTGKSTLLNTAFGLQFKVSAGKCTRGAFMRLLEMDDTLKERVNCDFILVVDTEGLRAPELDSVSLLKHDNELATFVIGLANVTVININGENPVNMDDILQTAVHAFLRMKCVVLKPSCQFVHQNVGSLMITKLEVGRLRFKEKLDEKTREAAKEEKLEGHFERFSDVIQFDDLKDIHYFPGLWDGALPMAAVKPEYSDRAQKLKVHLVECVKNSNNGQLSNFKTKLCDLWKALLHEKFIFSFKNTLEVAAYKALEAEYLGLVWDFQKCIVQWEQEAENDIKVNETVEPIESLNSKLKTFVAKKHDDLAEKLEQYFETSEMSFVLSQWRDTFKARLHNHAENLVQRAIKRLDELISNQRSFESVKKSHSRKRDEFLMKIKNTATSLRGQHVSHRQLKSVFDKLWIEWIDDIQPEYHSDVEVDVEADVQKTLMEFFRNYDGQVIGKLCAKSLKEWAGHLKVNVTHISARRLKKGRSVSLESSLIHAQTITDKFLYETKCYLKLMKRSSLSDVECNTQDLLRDVATKIDNCTHDQRMYFFTQEYKVDMCLTACGYAIKRFESLQEVVKKERDPFEYLVSMRESWFLLFQNMYLQIARESAAAGTFCDVLIISIEKKVMESLGHTIVDNMKLILHSKPALKARILLDLAINIQKKPDFRDYLCYLTDTRRSFDHWIKVYTKQHCEAQRVDGQSTFTYLLIRELENLLKFVKKKIEEVTEKAHSIKTWLLLFCQEKDLKCRLTLDVSSLFRCTVDMHNMLDVGKFSKQVIDILDQKEKDLQDQFSQFLFECFPWKSNPCDILFSQLQGCCETCPFCNEQCDCSNEGHDIKHSVQQHRPLYLGGRCVSTHEVVFDVDICASKVGSDAMFQNKDTKQKPHPFKEYMKIYPKWSIPVDMSVEVSRYWKWFVGKYYNDSRMTAYFGTVGPDSIPSYWKELKWDDVEKELKEQYDIL